MELLDLYTTAHMLSIGMSVLVMGLWKLMLFEGYIIPVCKLNACGMGMSRECSVG